MGYEPPFSLLIGKTVVQTMREASQSEINVAVAEFNEKYL